MISASTSQSSVFFRSLHHQRPPLCAIKTVNGTHCHRDLQPAGLLIRMNVVNQQQQNPRSISYRPLCSRCGTRVPEGSLVPLTRKSRMGSKGDEADGLLSKAFFGVVKTAVLYLLDKVLETYREDCHGCLTDDPGPKGHPCLETTTSHFYRDNFYTIIGKIYTPNFIPAIQHLLTLHNFPTEERRIRTAAGTVLFDLRSEAYVQHTIGDMYCALMKNHNTVKLADLSTVAYIWKQPATATTVTTP